MMALPAPTKITFGAMRESGVHGLLIAGKGPPSDTALPWLLPLFWYAHMSAVMSPARAVDFHPTTKKALHDRGD
jgi:hypothetical protein